MYKHPPPVLCLPNFFRSPACSWMFMLRYNVRLALRGENPILNQSTVLPLLSLVITTSPKPMMDDPHILGSSLVNSFIILIMVKLSLRFFSSSTELIKDSTDAVVGLVLFSAFFGFGAFFTVGLAVGFFTSFFAEAIFVVLAAGFFFIAMAPLSFEL